MDTHDVVVIGGGPVGLAAAAAIARRGRDVAVVERHAFGHDRGSSSGETRQFRIQHESEALTRLAIEAIPMWDELAAEGPPLLHRTPCVWFGDPAARGSTGRIEAVTRVMRTLDIPFDELTAADLHSRFPLEGLPSSWSGFAQSEGAVIDVRATREALHSRVVHDDRVTLRPASELLAITRVADGLRIETSSGDLQARKLVLAPGPHIGSVLALLGLRLDVTLWRMPSAWFAIRNPDVSWPMWVSFRDATDADPGQYYGFPEMPFAHPGYIRVAGNFPSTNPELPVDGDARPDPRGTELVAGWVARHMPGLDPEPHFASTCLAGLVTRSDDPLHVTHEMIVDLLPETLGGRGDIVVCSTGWMFKFIPLLGHVCADLACDGETPLPISDLRIDPDAGVITKDTNR